MEINPIQKLSLRLSYDEVCELKKALFIIDSLLRKLTVVDCDTIECNGFVTTKELSTAVYVMKQLITDSREREGFRVFHWNGWERDDDQSIPLIVVYYLSRVFDTTIAAHDY